ncbi:unnamed protein product [Spodoptera exigua]|nr:unnamed protein product [Spodoptera exigua]
MALRRSLVFLCVYFSVQNVICQFGFFPQRGNRHNGFFGQEFMQPRRPDRFSNFFNLQPKRPVINPENNQENIYVYEISPGSPNQYDYNGRPVVFPTNRPIYNQNGLNNGNVNFQNNPNNVNFQNPNNGNFQQPSYDGSFQPAPNDGSFQPAPSDGSFQPAPNDGSFQPAPSDGSFQPAPNDGSFQPAPSDGSFQSNPSDGSFQTNNDNEVNTNQEKPPQNGSNGGFQDVNTNTTPGPEDIGVTAPNDPVNFEDVSTWPPLTPVPTVSTESRNSFNFQQNQGVFKETCQTVENGLGTCISVYECQPYISVLRESRTNPNAVQLLRRAHCGFEGTTPKVCCPLPGFPEPPVPLPATTTTTTTTTPKPTTAPPAPNSAVKISPEDFVPALPDPPICGFSNASLGRVVGGVDAALGDFPWMALLGYKSKRTGTTNWLCGGSLISSRHVLTAAHCIHNHEEDLYVVRLGELDLAKEDEGATPVDVLIKQKVKHEQYSATSFTNDIGILILDHDVTFTELIKPICMPKDEKLRATTFEDYNPLIAGWGHTEFRGAAATHLQVLQLPVVGNDFCMQAYSAYKAQKIDERVLCAGYKQGGKDACQGDSGGPLMQPIWSPTSHKTYFYQIGVVSYGKKCAEANFPGVYSRVTHFIPWIEQKVLGRTAT